MAQDNDALARLYERAQLSFSSVQKELDALRSGLGIGGVGTGVGALAAGNSACDSGCDGGCGALSSLGTAVNPAELKERLTARVSAVLAAHKSLGTDPLSKLASGNEACDSGCNSGCGGKIKDIVTNPVLAGK